MQPFFNLTQQRDPRTLLGGMQDAYTAARLLGGIFGLNSGAQGELKAAGEQNRLQQQNAIGEQELQSMTLGDLMRNFTNDANVRRNLQGESLRGATLGNDFAEQSMPARLAGLNLSNQGLQQQQQQSAQLFPEQLAGVQLANRGTRQQQDQSRQIFPEQLAQAQAGTSLAQSQAKFAPLQARQNLNNSAQQIPLQQAEILTRAQNGLGFGPQAEAQNQQILSQLGQLLGFDLNSPQPTNPGGLNDQLQGILSEISGNQQQQTPFFQIGQYGQPQGYGYDLGVQAGEGLENLLRLLMSATNTAPLGAGSF